MKRHNFILLCLSILFLSGCSKTYVPTQDIITKSEGLSISDAVKLLQENVYTPNVEHPNWLIYWHNAGGIDRLSTIEVNQKSIQYINGFKAGKRISGSIYQKKRHTYDPILFKDVDDLNIYNEKLSQNFCDIGSSTHEPGALVVLIFGFGANFAVCVKDRADFYAAAYKLLPHAENKIY